jgi:5,10-methenyltetrahydromethanopterin hydrogenase
MNLRETLNKIINEELLLLERKSKAKSKFKVLQDNKVQLTDDERKEVMDADAVWHFSPGNKPSPAVWKSINKKTGETTYVTNTHRAYNTAPTLKGAISRYHKFIKGTA